MIEYVGSMWSVGRSVRWSVSWSVSWSFGWSIGQTVDQLGVSQLVGLSVRQKFKPENNAKTPVCWIASKFALNSKPEINMKVPVCWIASKFALNSKPENNTKTSTEYSFQINLIFPPHAGNFPP